jgi:acyl carrier protein
MEVELNNLTDPRPPADPAAGPDASAIAPKIRDFVARNFLFSEQGFQYEDDASFLGEGIIDSLGIIELVPFVEKTFGIAVADHELLPNNFDSVQKLTSFIARKVGAAS